MSKIDDTHEPGSPCKDEKFRRAVFPFELAATQAREGPTMLQSQFVEAKHASRVTFLGFHRPVSPVVRLLEPRLA